MNVAPIEAVAQLFEGHGVPVESVDDCIRVAGFGHTIDVSLDDVPTSPDIHGVELTIGIDLADGRRLVENFAGIGDTRETATGDAFANFMQTSLHVLTTLFFHVTNGHIRVEEWNVGGETRSVFSGAYTQRTDATEELPHVEWFPVLQAALAGRKLSPGPHWLRLFHASDRGRVLANEVMIDNEPWPEAEAKVAALDWPKLDAFYSVRFFLGLDDKRE